MGFLSVPNLVPWLIFIAWIVTDLFSGSHCTSTWQGEGKRKRRWREEPVGGDYFKYFCHKGAIIRGRRLIKGRLLFEESLSKHMKTIFFGSQYVRKYNSWGWVRLALTVLPDVTTPFKFNTFLWYCYWGNCEVPRPCLLFYPLGTKYVWQTKSFTLTMSVRIGWRKAKK